MTKSVVLIDPFSGGHHDYYAGELAFGLKKKQCDVYAIGEGNFVENLSNKIELKNYQVINFYKDEKRLNYEINKVVFLNKALSYAKKFNVDVVHLLTFDKFIIPMFFNNYYNFQSELRATLHHGYFLITQGKSLKSILVNKSEINILKYLFKKGLRVMVHSELLATKINSLIQKKMFFYVPYPVKKPVFYNQKKIGLSLRNTLDIPKDVFLIFVFGGTRFSKGCDLAIQALEKLPPQYHLLIAGNEEHFTKQVIMDIAKKHSVEDRIHLDLGFIPDDRVLHYFASSDLVLLPYRNEFSGQSGPLTIAATMNIPILASNTIVFQEMIKKYNIGYLFQVEDIQSMSDMIYKVSLIKDKAINNERFCNEHDTDNFLKSVYSNYLVL